MQNSPESQTANRQSHPDRQGLSPEQVLESRRLHGENLLTPPKREAWWKQLLKKFQDPIIRILMVAAVLACLTGQAVEAIGILVAVVLATVLGFLNEMQAEKEFDVLNQVNEDTPVKVIRQGGLREIPRREVVVGDLVLLDQGEEVPADLEFLETTELLLDQSRLTGESVPVEKCTREEAQSSKKGEETYPAWQGLKGTPVVQGHALGVVTEVGAQTELGRTALAAAEISSEQTPLMKQLSKLAEQIGAVGMAISGLVFLVLLVHAAIVGNITQNAHQWIATVVILVAGVFALTPVWFPSLLAAFEMFHHPIKAPRWLSSESHASWLAPLGGALAVLIVGLGAMILTGALPASPAQWLSESAISHLISFFMVTVALIVMAMPEGLPMSVTLALAYSMRKMIATNNLVRRMHACETIGAATVICTDKTGTLTQNQMRVQHFAFPESKAALLQLAIAANSTAELSLPEDAEQGAEPIPLGNPTEGALLLWLHQKGVDYQSLRKGFRCNAGDQWSFTTERKFMATRGSHDSLGETPWLFLKGAPEILLKRCDRRMTDGNDATLSEAEKESLLQEIHQWQLRGMRILGFAGRPAPDMASTDENAVAQELIWMGFTAIADPVRQEVPHALSQCRKAGIRVKMVTGDSPETAREIGRQSHLWSEEEEKDGLLLTGPEFQALPDDEARKAASKLRIMARARPNDKLRLVQCLRDQNEVVAVTGDGTNDAPALNRADVGIAMGKAGTSVAKEAADIILLDDSFPSIVQAVLWGRSLYQNLQKFLIFQLTVNFVALAIAILGPLLDLEMPLTVIQVLWINLIMDTFAAIALATDPPDPAVLEVPPRVPGAFIITPAMCKQILFTGLPCLAVLLGFLFYMQTHGLEIHDNWSETPHATQLMLTRFFCLFVFLQFWNLFRAKCWGTKDAFFLHATNNSAFLCIAAIILLGQVAIVTFGGQIFRTVPLPPQEWFILLIATSLILLPEAFKRKPHRD